FWLRIKAPLALLALLFAIPGSPALAQTPHHHPEAGTEADIPGLCGICPAGRDGGDGTSWEPDDAVGHEHGWMAGKWLLSAHLQGAATQTRETRPRGDEQVSSTNFGMFDGRRRLGSGVFGFRSMWSLEPAMGAR